jgi:hypothetical protein
LLFLKSGLKGVLLEAVGFAGEPFYAIAIGGFFKIPGAGAESGLEGGAGGNQRHIVNPEWVKRKALPFPEQLFDQLAAFEPLLLAKCEFTGADRRSRGLFQIGFVGNGQFVTTFCATAGQYFTTIGRLHAFAETVNGLAAAGMWLKCTFHC